MTDLTPPAEAVERVARALCAVATANARRDTGDDTLAATYGWQDWLPDARAAIAALSTPANVAAGEGWERLRDAVTPSPFWHDEQAWRDRWQSLSSPAPPAAEAEVREALANHSGIQSGPDGNGGMRVCIHFAKPGDEIAFLAALTALPAADVREAVTGPLPDCPYNHPIGTRCPSCANWPYAKGCAEEWRTEQNAAAIRSGAEAEGDGT